MTMQNVGEFVVGEVKWFNNKKGYGFIAVPGSEDVFVHYRNIQQDGFRSLRMGQKVKFVIIDGPKGLQAESVLLMD